MNLVIPLTNSRNTKGGLMRQTLSVTVVGLLAVLVFGCGSGDSGLYDETYDSYFRSFSYDYEPAETKGDLADLSEVVVKATLVDVQEGRLFAVADEKPELEPDEPIPAEYNVKLNFVFETDDGTRYYVQLPRPHDSSIAQVRSVMPIGAASVIYLQPDNDPIVDGAGRWFNVREDGNEWYFTTPQGWILDHPERGITFPLERADHMFAVMPALTDPLDDWLPEQTTQAGQDFLE